MPSSQPSHWHGSCTIFRTRQALNVETLPHKTWTDTLVLRHSSFITVLRLLLVFLCDLLKGSPKEIQLFRGQMVSSSKRHSTYHSTSNPDVGVRLGFWPFLFHTCLTAPSGGPMPYCSFCFHGRLGGRKASRWSLYCQLYLSSQSVKLIPDDYTHYGICDCLLIIQRGYLT